MANDNDEIATRVQNVKGIGALQYPALAELKTISEASESESLAPGHPNSPTQPQNSLQAESWETQPLQTKSQAIQQQNSVQVISREEMPDDLNYANDDSELIPYGWNDLESRFQLALQDVHKEETKLCLEFEKLMAGFLIWADSGSRQENNRATKRVKTRARYVQLSEDALEAKKTHYIHVVQAFKTALELLRG